jgi:hypothetical protein
MSRSSVRSAACGRAQVEPLPALVVVIAVCVGISTYASAVGTTLSGPTERNVASSTLTQVRETMTENGIVDPTARGRVRTSNGHGLQVNVTVAAGDTAWHVGEAPPADPAVATERVSIRRTTATVRAGHLTVRVWR